MILVVDNYDSFTWNIVHLIRSEGAECEVVRNDAVGVEQLMKRPIRGVLISPGPGRPESAGISLALVAACAGAGLPLLGVCLGHQALAMALGGRIERAPAPVHGKPSRIEHDGSGLFADLDSPMIAIRYNSLTVDGATLPCELVANAKAEDGTIQGLRHGSLPLHGVQFHPESIGSPCGRQLIRNFLNLSAA